MSPSPFSIERSEDPTPYLLRVAIPRTAALLTGVIAVAVLAGAAAGAVAPGQRIADFVAAHAHAGDRAQLRGVAIEGGHVSALNGAAVVRDATAVVLTHLPRAASSRPAALRLCQLATRGVVQLRIRSVSRVAVTDRGDVAANGDYVPMVVTEQRAGGTVCAWQ